MENINKDILSEIGNYLEYKDVLNTRLVSKRFARILFYVMGKRFVFCLDPIIYNLFSISLSKNNELMEQVFDKIIHIKNIRIKELKNIIDFEAKFLELICNIETIEIEPVQKNYSFLSYFKSVKIIKCQSLSTGRAGLPIPIMESVKEFVINDTDVDCYYRKLNAKLLAEKMPNLERLTCNRISLNISSLPKLRYLCLNADALDIVHNISFDSLEEFILNERLYNRIVNLNGKIIMPKLKRLCLNSLTVNTDAWKDIHHHMVYSYEKLEYLNICGELKKNKQLGQ